MSTNIRQWGPPPPVPPAQEHTVVMAFARYHLASLSVLRARKRSRAVCEQGSAEDVAEAAAAVVNARVKIARCMTALEAAVAASGLPWPTTPPEVAHALVREAFTAARTAPMQLEHAAAVRTVRKIVGMAEALQAAHVQADGFFDAAQAGEPEGAHYADACDRAEHYRSALALVLGGA